MADDTRRTTDHETIRRWAEERSGRPVTVGATREGPSEVIGLAFPGAAGSQDGALEEVSWDEWFRQSEQHSLEFIDQETTAEGEKSHFNKLVAREPV